MKLLILSDIHANGEALRSVLSRTRRKRFDATLCLGDFVGYGPDPNQVVDLMRGLKGRKIYIRGNHDRVAAGLDDGYGFNHSAKEVALWTRERLSTPNRSFLQKLAQGPLQFGEVLLCHGSPRHEDEYVFNEIHAADIFARHDARIILYGHTHLPAFFSIDAEGRVRGSDVEPEKAIRLDARRRYLINPGSVGQPRDRNAGASYAVLDVRRGTLQYARVPYDYTRTQASILKAGLPRIFADRLTYGQ